MGKSLTPGFSRVKEGIMLNTNTLMLRAQPHKVRAARVFTAASLSRWDMAALTDTAVLVVSELVTNAVQNTASDGTVKVWLWTDGQSLLIEVRDSAPGFPFVVKPTVNDE